MQFRTYDRYLNDIRDMICGRCAVHESRTRILIVAAKRAREVEKTERGTKETEEVDSMCVKSHNFMRYNLKRLG